MRFKSSRERPFSGRAWWGSVPSLRNTPAGPQPLCFFLTSLNPCHALKETVACILDDQGKDAEARFDLSIDSPLGFTPSTVACNALLGQPKAGDQG